MLPDAPALEPAPVELLPVVLPVAEPVDEPVAEPVDEPVVEPVVEPVLLLPDDPLMLDSVPVTSTRLLTYFCRSEVSPPWRR
jgi:hypothetical protein